MSESYCFIGFHCSVLSDSVLLLYISTTKEINDTCIIFPYFFCSAHTAVYIYIHEYDPVIVQKEGLMYLVFEFFKKDS